MKVAISGAQSTGKTTLISKIKRDLFFKNFVIEDEITRDIKKKGLGINESGTDYTQCLIMFEHFIRVENRFKNIIFDRCALDGLVYTQYLYEINQVSEQTLKYAKIIFNNIIDKYDKIFYILPEFDIENDGTRSSSKKFRDRVVEIFDEIIKENKLNVILLSGTVKERLNLIKKEL